MKNRLIIIAIIFFIVGIIISPFLININLLVIALCYKEVYHMISSIFGIVTSCMGIAFGYYYFSEKRKYTLLQDLNNKKCYYINRILDEYDEIDKIILQIFYMNIQNNKELSISREKIISHFDMITTLIECIESNENFIEFTNQELKLISGQYSYIEKNKSLMHIKLGDLKKEKNIKIFKNTYQENYRNIKKTLHLKMT